MRNIKGFTYRKLCGRLSLLAGILSAIVTIVLFEHSLYRDYIIYTWFVVVFLCTFVGIYWQHKSDIYGRYWLAFAIILGISNGFLAGIVGRTLFLLTNDFGGSIGSVLVASIIAALFGGIVSLLSLRIVYGLDQNRFLFYIVATYAVGIASATVNTHIFDWWYSSICTLGMPSHLNSDIYNSTLVIVGILVALFATYMVPQFRILFRKKLISRPKIITISIIYLLESIGIMSVGIFPFGINHFIAGVHVFFGAFIFYDIGALMLLSAWLFSNFPVKFLVTNYLLLIIGVMCYSISFILCFVVKVKWLPFPLAEFTTVIILITWFLMTLKYIKRLSQNSIKSDRKT